MINMASMTAQKHTIDEFNGGTGDEYSTQTSSADDFTKVVENSVFAVDKAEQVEAIGDTQPDNTDAGNVGTPAVSLIGTGATRQLKFSNLKGATGSQGIQGKSYAPQGEWADETDYYNTLTVIDTITLLGTTYYCIQSHTSSVANQPVDRVGNAYWGVLALSGSDAAVTIEQTTGTSTTAVMSQNAVTTALGNKINTSDIATSLGTSNTKVVSQALLNTQMGIVSQVVASGSLTNPSAGDTIVNMSSYAIGFYELLIYSANIDYIEVTIGSAGNCAGRALKSFSASSSIASIGYATTTDPATWGSNSPIFIANATGITYLSMNKYSSSTSDTSVIRQEIKNSIADEKIISTPTVLTGTFTWKLVKIV